MPRYMVQRTFPEGLHIPVAGGGAAVCATVVERNAEEGVTWVHSYVSADKRTTFCIYDAPNPEAVRKTATRKSAAGGRDHRSQGAGSLLLRLNERRTNHVQANHETDHARDGRGHRGGPRGAPPLDPTGHELTPRLRFSA